jgi:hypothetical protein
MGRKVFLQHHAQIVKSPPRDIVEVNNIDGNRPAQGNLTREERADVPQRD